ncbi:MAG: DUF4411 family protein [Ectothiorhodospiraceae bacterium AqS1]|nr:DUF4411 family protein [Ectothiorhodospiraceae bacterium AqS1]
MLFVFDSSTLIAIRENYLRSTGLFKHFWGWLLGHMHSGRIIVPAAAFKELQDKKPEGDEFFNILVEENIPPRKLDAAIREQIKGIQKVLEPVKHKLSKGDRQIMATAKALGATLVTEESQETPPPLGSSKPYKMPGACQLAGIDVKCLNMRKFLIEIAKERSCRPNELL